MLICAYCCCCCWLYWNFQVFRWISFWLEVFFALLLLLLFLFTYLCCCVRFYFINFCCFLVFLHILVAVFVSYFQLFVVALFLAFFFFLFYFYLIFLPIFVVFVIDSLFLLLLSLQKLYRQFIKGFSDFPLLSPTISPPFPSLPLLIVSPCFRKLTYWQLEIASRLDYIRPDMVIACLRWLRDTWNKYTSIQACTYV